MKTLKILLPIFFVFTTFVTFGQKANASRTETESWLLQKLNTNINSYTLYCINPANIIELSVCFTHTNITFSISGDNLIVNADTKRHEKGMKKARMKIIKRNGLYRYTPSQIRIYA